MSRYCEYEQFSLIGVKNLEGLKKAIKKYDFAKDICFFEKFKDKTLLSLGYHDDEELDTQINHFHPNQDDVWDFICEISKYLEDYALMVWDEEFLNIYEQKGYAWRIINSKGQTRLYDVVLNVKGLAEMEEGQGQGSEEE